MIISDKSDKTTDPGLAESVSNPLATSSKTRYGTSFCVDGDLTMTAAGRDTPANLLAG
jgi:hypothetical protein